MHRIQNSKWLSSKPHVMVLSLLLAVVLWAVVVLSVNRTATRTIDGIVVEIPSSGTSYQARGLDIIDNGEMTYTVSITVSGDRTVIGALTADSFSVTPDFSTVMTAGAYTLPLQAEKTNQFQNFTISSISPADLNLTFDEVITEKFNVTPEISALEVADGYVLQNITCTPASILISGAQSAVAKVDQVVARASLSGELSGTQSVRAEVVLLDSFGNELKTDGYRLDYTEAEILIPVYKEGELELAVGFINVPDGFDLSTLSYTMSPERIRVASTEENINALGKKTVGYIDLAAFTFGEGYEFDITLSTGYANLDNVEKVVVNFDEKNLASRKITVTDIRVNNVPDGYEVKVVSAAINGVTVIGAKEAVENLMVSGVVAEVDASAITADQGTVTVPVRFFIPSTDSVWVAGTYQVTVEVTKP